MQCPKCKFQCTDDMQYCGKCGSKLTVYCQICGYDNHTGHQFCVKCGNILHHDPFGAISSYANTPKYVKNGFELGSVDQIIKKPDRERIVKNDALGNHPEKTAASMDDTQKELYLEWQRFRQAIATAEPSDIRFSKKLIPTDQNGGSAIRVVFEATGILSIPAPSYPIVSYSVIYDPREPSGYRCSYLVGSEMDFWIKNRFCRKTIDDFAQPAFHNEAKQLVFQRFKEQADSAKDPNSVLYKYYDTGVKKNASFRKINQKKHTLWQNLCDVADRAEPSQLVFRESEPSVSFWLKKIGDTPIPDNRYWMFHKDPDQNGYLVTSWHQRIPKGDQYREYPEWISAKTDEEAAQILLSELKIIVGYIKRISQSYRDSIV